MNMRCFRAGRGSGLIIALAILALMAIMGTSFITLMRVDVRIVRNYVDDQHCEMVVHGMLNYFKALLRDDLDRGWGKYENRDTAVGYYGINYWNNGAREIQIPGLYQSTLTPDPGINSGEIYNDARRGTPVSNDFWMSTSYTEWGTTGGSIYDTVLDVLHQQSFACFVARGNYDRCVVGRMRVPNMGGGQGRDFDVWVGRSQNALTADGRTVQQDHPDAAWPIDDDGDGVFNPRLTNGGAFTRENMSEEDYYWDNPPFVVFEGPTGYHDASRIIGEQAGVGGVAVQWGVKIGPTQSAYVNLNTAGNLDGADPAYLASMSGIGLGARRANDETSSTIPSAHLGRIEWWGFNGEYERGNHSGFPMRYNNVWFSPASANLEKVFQAHAYSGYAPYPPPEDLKIDRDKARALIRYRWGGDGRAATGADCFRVGWRRDGASYYKFPSPENPLGNDRYFGANEVMEHDHAVNHPSTSAVAGIVGEEDWQKLRPSVTMWSTDTILRGKIWPTEGPPYTATQGDWRHLDILKRVNINIIGAKTPDALSGNSTKSAWAAKRVREQTRLYYMLVNALKYTGTGSSDSDRRHMVCQFIASLCDTVDWDMKETYFEDPDDPNVWALGVEKQPVINEVALHLTNANKADYTLSSLRVEIYNPMENIPWIPDVDEAYDISNYILEIASHTYRLGDLRRFSYANVNTDLGPVTTIGADGMFSDPKDLTPNRQSWQRLVAVGWPGGGWPTGLTKSEVDPKIEISLWKPLEIDGLTAPQRARLLATSGVKEIDGVLYLRVDHTGLGSDAIQLIRTHGANNGPSLNSTYVGIYRRWDPLNARVFGMVGLGRDSNVIWVDNRDLTAATLGKPNVGYPSPWDNGGLEHKRRFECNFKVVDGDLPSIGWLGELVMRNCAQDGPVTWMHRYGQNPRSFGWAGGWYQRNDELDVKGKFDLFRPFLPAGKYQPKGTEIDSVNLHVLDMFTVYDPSNDGEDNDGDGAVDDQDTGRQAGDKGGPEIRVFGQLDMNSIVGNAMGAAWPDGAALRVTWYGRIYESARSMRKKVANNTENWGPYETVGDFIRADEVSPNPGSLIGSLNVLYDGRAWPNYQFMEGGIAPLREEFEGDDDGDGIYDERDERDMVFTWVCNHFTTRANVFTVDVNVRLCEPPYYPGRVLPYRVGKSRVEYARKQTLGILDRSTCLRVNPDGTCDFTGPVEVRMLRVTDDLRVP